MTHKLYHNMYIKVLSVSQHPYLVLHLLSANPSVLSSSTLSWLQKPHLTLNHCPTEALLTQNAHCMSQFPQELDTHPCPPAPSPLPFHTLTLALPHPHPCPPTPSRHYSCTWLVFTIAKHLRPLPFLLCG
jgi:hypothetical protein